tara:strand:+ start:3490 stop:4011 length:522 start_codon:yes stop_codon:yes gene_type:complete
MLRVADLVHDPANVRKHSDRNIEAIKSSLARFGQQKPIVVNGDNVVLAGNGTLMACKSLGWDNLWVEITPLKGSEATAYSIADNRSAELAEWDDDELAQMLTSLQNDDSIDHLVAGYTDEEIAKLVNKVMGEETDPAEFNPEYLVLITCSDEEQQSKVFQMCQDQNLEVKLLS